MLAERDGGGFTPWTPLAPLHKWIMNGLGCCFCLSGEMRRQRRVAKGQSHFIRSESPDWGVEGTWTELQERIERHLSKANEDQEMPRCILKRRRAKIIERAKPSDGPVVSWEPMLDPTWHATDNVDRNGSRGVLHYWQSLTVNCPFLCQAVSRR